MEGKSTEDFEAIAEAAISGGQWELVKSCLGRGMSKALMNRALVEALKSGQWDTVPVSYTHLTLPTKVNV